MDDGSKMALDYIDSYEYTELLLTYLIRDGRIHEKTKSLGFSIDLLGDKITGNPVYREFAAIALEIDDSPISRALFLDHYHNKLRNGELDEEDQINMVEFIDSIYANDLKNSDYIYRTLPEFVKRTTLHNLQHKHREDPERYAKEIQEFLAKQNEELPPIRSVGSIKSKLRAAPVELVKGILHKGSQMVFGGGSKSFKTWNLQDLALSVATGEKWLGFETTKSKVLYLDFELTDYWFDDRLLSIANKKLVELPKEGFDYWTLRGHAANIDDLIPKIIKQAEGKNYGLIILDPIYKCLGKRDENAAGDMASLMNALEKLAVQTGAAVVFGHHFSKGNQAGKAAIDRVSGSGVFGRHPDTIITLTLHEAEMCYTVDVIVRNFRPVEPFVLRWDCPLMVRDNSLDPSTLREVGGRKPVYAPENLIGVLAGHSEGMTLKEWQDEVVSDSGMSVRTFATYKKTLKDAGKVHQVNGKWKVHIPDVKDVAKLQ